MKQFIQKMYSTTTQELAIKTFGLLLVIISSAYLVTYVVKVG